MAKRRKCPGGRAKFKRCVRKARGRGVKNPYAVCQARLGRKKGRRKRRRR